MQKRYLYRRIYIQKNKYIKRDIYDKVYKRWSMYIVKYIYSENIYMVRL